MLRRWIAVAVIALVATTATTAHAARLGGANGVTAKKLYAFSAAGQDALPTERVKDAFDTNTTGVSLDGQASDTFQLWDLPIGGITQQSGQIRCSTCAGATYAVGRIDAYKPNGTLTADLTPATAGTVGVILDVDTALSHMVVVWVTGNTLELSTYANNVITSRKTATFTGRVTATRTLTVVALNGTYTASYGTANASFTMPAGEYTGYNANTLTGVIFMADNGNSRLDNFKVTK